MNKELEIMESAVRASGPVLRRYFGQALSVTEKSMNADFQTKADTESEETILVILRGACPGYNIHAEETGFANNNSDDTFFVDPLDGSNNFVTGISYFSIAIALRYKEEVVVSAIYDPIADRMYTAIKGGDSYRNGRRILVNKEADIKRVTVGYAPSYLHLRSLGNALFVSLHRDHRTKRFLTSWSTCMDFCLLAEGSIEASIVNGVEFHDFLAGKLLAREAGARLTDWIDVDGADDVNSQFMITNGTGIHETLLTMVQACLQESSKQSSL